MSPDELERRAKLTYRMNLLLSGERYDVGLEAIVDLLALVIIGGSDDSLEAARTIDKATEALARRVGQNWESVKAAARCVAGSETVQ